MIKQVVFSAGCRRTKRQSLWFLALFTGKLAQRCVSRDICILVVLKLTLNSGSDSDFEAQRSREKLHESMERLVLENQQMRDLVGQLQSDIHTMAGSIRIRMIATLQPYVLELSYQRLIAQCHLKTAIMFH